MGVDINIEGQWAGLVPRILSKVCRLGAFDGEELIAKFPDGTTKSIRVRDKLNAAWKHVLKRAGHSGSDCNGYFKGLPRKKSLLEVMNEGKITLHRLVPLPHKTLDDLPAAISAGRDIGFDPTLLFESDHVLACTLIHELAHVAGATTATNDPEALAAENALNHCGCKNEFRKENLGMIQDIASSNSRLA